MITRWKNTEREIATHRKRDEDRGDGGSGSD
jgi:hypothetical protein